MKIIISHRGNLHGPNSCVENSTKAIFSTIAQEFDVEVDLWCIDNEFWFGHNKPEFQVSALFLTTCANRLWVHAKNGQALEHALLLRLRCFFHSTDAYTLTSSGNIWAFPDANTHISSEKTVVVLPETQCPQGLFDAFAVCTDYPILLRCANISKNPHEIWKQGLILDEVYNEIQNRKNIVFKPDLLCENDQRRCIAIFSDFFDNSYLIHVSEVTRNHLREHHIYTLFSTPRLHFTWMQFSSFEHCAKNIVGPEMLHFFSTKVKEADNECDLAETTYTIVFHRVVIVPTSIMLVGYANFPVLPWRQYLRTNCRTHRDFHEPHPQNIVHSTLARFAHVPNLDLVQSALKDIQRLLPFSASLKPKMLRSCSFRMGEEVSR